MQTGLTYIGRYDFDRDVGGDLSKLETELVLWDVTVHNTQRLHEQYLTGRIIMRNAKNLEEAMLMYHLQQIEEKKYFKRHTVNPSLAIAQYRLD